MKSTHTLSFLAALVATSVTSLAAAQVGAEENAAGAAATSDHDSVVGHLGVGYLGRQTMLIGSGGAAQEALNVPVVGVRYWLSPMLGIDAGLGFLMTSGSTEVSAATTDETDKVGVMAGMLHAGLPLSLASSGHFSFQVVPELNIGTASASDAEADPEESFSGFHFDIGARAGAEVHFGFIDIPQLSLQGSVGLFLQVDSTSSTVESTPEQSISDSTTVLGTTLGGDPWDIFTGSISAIYYL